MNRILLLALIALFLTACGAHTVKDDSPASDLDAMMLGAKQELQRRTLPNGKLYCAELARTEQEQDECMGDLEDTLWRSEGDKDSAVAFLQKAVQRIKLRLNPCGFWKSLFNKEECHVP